MADPRTKYPMQEALQRLRQLCARQERCQSDLYRKLRDWGFYHSESEQMLAQLISEGFLNEERFAIAFVRGKFRIKGWGKRKIVNHLKRKGVSERNIQTGLAELEDTDYNDGLMQLIAKKKRLMRESDPYVARTKLGRFLIQKGYEPELVWKTLSEHDQ